MISIDTLREFPEWCTIINIGILPVATILIVFARSFISRIHSKLFKLSDTDWSCACFQFPGHYKLAIYVSNLVPYIALRIMT